jgi:hypothetical protein
MQKTTVIVNTKTRDILKRIGTNGQTYDKIIAELLTLKTKQPQQGWSV